MKLIPLTQGMSAKVDDEDFDRINKLKWYVQKRPNSYYAKREVMINGVTKVFMLHNFIMNPPIGLLVDHRDFDGLNCQKSNLRICTRSQNNAYRHASKSGTSKYLGVSIRDGWNKKRIVAAIRKNKKTISLGDFKTEKEAALAYNNAALIHHGEYANLNFK
jgi:hypothetical protein